MASGSQGRLAGWGLVGLVAVVALLFIGSWMYWIGEGRPGTPDDFRQQVADTGLDVAWSNSGPRGGSGVVDTSCGPVVVDIDDSDGELFIRWAGNRAPVTDEVIDAIMSCSTG